MSVVKEMLRTKGYEAIFEDARRVAREYVCKLRAEGRISFSDAAPGRLTTIHIVRRTLPEVWEDTTMALLGVGQPIHTHYDPRDAKGNFVSFPSLEATVMMHIEEPFSEPRFHKHYLGGWMGFGDYRAEIEGTKDHWMIPPALVAEKIKTGRFDEIKGDERWNYTYSQRLRAYPYFDYEGRLRTINQIKSVINNLKRDPTSRSAQCITWDPRWDHNDEQMGPFKWESYHAPCLQRLWFRLVTAPTGHGYVLNLNAHWRSRDHLKAVPSNVYGLLEGMYEEVRLGLEKELDVPVQRGGYTDINDSLHLYGHYLDPRVQGLDAESYLEDVFRIASGEPIEQRVILPGTDMYEMMREDLEREYLFRKENPDFGRPGH
ncbi:MAG: thymidylate synthase [Kiritimatiellae bacterium]|nr:thymidylate synthase [Kiritimatiellia bacterium]